MKLEYARTPDRVEAGRGSAAGRRAGGTGHRWLALAAVAMLFVLTGCAPPGNVGQVSVTLGESTQFSRAELQAAADAVLAACQDFEDCTRVDLTFDQSFSDGQLKVAAPPLPKGRQAVVFDSEFRVGRAGQNNGLNPNSTYSGWTWTVTRTDATAPWTVTNYGVG